VRKYWRSCLSDTILIRFAAGTTPAVLGFGALTAIVLGAYDYTGGALTGYKKDPEMDEFERKEALRKNRRRPIEETIHELGEGRGTFSTDIFRSVANYCGRYLWSRIPRETSRANQGEVWY
jgi:hypothetical protein